MSSPKRSEALDKQSEKEHIEKDSNICRDFLNNICNRGSRCKFTHPNQKELKPKEKYNFCIDFQNQGCIRDTCRFIHADRDDVELYQRTGEVSHDMARAIFIDTRSETINGIPVCKEYLNNGICERNTRCRYWHVAYEDARERRRYGSQQSAGSKFPKRYPVPLISSGSRRRGPVPDFEYDMPKRPMYSGYSPHIPAGDMMGGPPASIHRITDLERRNAELTTEVESLKRELRREKERYEDLLSIFRQTNNGIGLPKNDHSDLQGQQHMPPWGSSVDNKYSW